MELRKLKSLLRTLQAAGVTKYRDGDLELHFGGMLPVPTGEVEGDVEGLELPPGTPNPLAALERIRKAYLPPPQKGRAS